MKRIILLLLLITLSPIAFAQQAPASIAQQLYSFSPMAQIYLKHLGLADKNSNGVIDKGAGEGYEAFVTKYGNADMGFHANGVIFGTANGKLEEPEIINHYYINIRFKPKFQQETAAIEGEIKAYVYANNIPLVWLDDQQGTLMNAVNKILGEGWNEQKVSEDEAVVLFNRTMRGLRIRDRTGIPSQNGGYYTLPEFIRCREGYCFEIALFGYWLFSELKKNSIAAQSALTPDLSHEVVRLTDSNTMVDFSKLSLAYPDSLWYIENPLECLSIFYSIETKKTNQGNLLTRAVLYNKYNIETICILMFEYMKSLDQNYNEIITCGEFILANIDIAQIINSINVSSATKHNVEAIILYLLNCYSLTGNQYEFNKILDMLSVFNTQTGEI